MKSILKIIAAALGAAITLNGIALFFVSNANFGNFLTVVLGLAIIFVALAFKRITKWLRNLLIAIIMLAVIGSSFLIIYGKSDNTVYNEDAVIVLGAAVHGDTPSLTLKNRLDKAIEYHAQNPDAIIVVSGGQGNGENVTEASAMEKYLIEHGVDKTKIIQEAKATSTYENFLFSKEILDKHFDTAYTVCFITNEYHVLRSKACAGQVGIENTSYLHSDTKLSYLVSGSLRECFAVIKYVIFKK